MPTYVVGVDGGTTKTIALVADGEGRILGACRGGGSNWSGADVEVPMAVVVDTVRQALVEAGLEGKDVAVAVFCLAGADWPEDHERRYAYLQACGLAQRVVVKNDAFAGLRAGTRRPYGVVIAAGTGTNTAVITPDGREWAFGYYAAQGGAADIADEAIWAVLRQEDGRGQPTALTGLVLQALELDCPDNLMRALVAGQVEHRRLLGLCRLVFQAAHAGDKVAADIIARQGQTLGEYATAAIRRFAMSQLEFDVVLAGSVFKGEGPLLVDTITREVHAQAPRAHVVRVELEPAVGAVLLACDALGLETGQEVYRNLADTVPGESFFSTADGGRHPPTHRRRKRRA